MAASPMTWPVARFARTTLLATAAAMLAACATAPPPMAITAPPGVTWHDARFAGAPPAEAPPDLFDLPPDLRARLLASPVPQGARKRLDRVLDVIFGTDRQGFRYAEGPSTAPAETWRLRRGDCLSLALLTHAAARELGLDAVLQEVEVPPVLDRRGRLDYVARHVNVRVRVTHSSQVDHVLYPVDVTIDFEAGPGPKAARRVLAPRAALARFHSNLGVHHLAQGDAARAYANLKAAIRADPAYAGAHANLAQLYRQAGLQADAASLLRRAAALSDWPEVPLRSLQGLLLEQGRAEEARELEAWLAERRHNDPYHWLAEGMQRLEAGDVRGAVAALELAQSLATGFAELHQALALAYWRSGRAEEARAQVAKLAALDAGDRKLAKLQGKMGVVP